MFQRLRTLTGRTALALFLVLATQLTQASQLCYSIASSVDGQSRSGAAIELPCAAPVAAPCCDNGTLHKALCLSNPADLGASAPGAAPASASAPPAAVWHVVALLGVLSSASRPLAATPAGHSPPSYILFSRFLS